jgi:hypothetical protein
MPLLHESEKMHRSEFRGLQYNLFFLRVFRTNLETLEPETGRYKSRAEALPLHNPHSQEWLCQQNHGAAA